MTESELQVALQKLRKLKGFAPMTPQEAEAAYDVAEPVPMSKEEIEEIVSWVIENDDRINRSIL